MTLKLCELRGVKLKPWVDHVLQDPNNTISNCSFSMACGSIRDSLEDHLGERYQHWGSHAADYLQWSDEVMIERLDEYTDEDAKELGACLDR